MILSDFQSCEAKFNYISEEQNLKFFFQYKHVFLFFLNIYNYKDIAERFSNHRPPATMWLHH
jgi:hypothetical protein